MKGVRVLVIKIVVIYKVDNLKVFFIRQDDSSGH